MIKRLLTTSLLAGTVLLAGTNAEAKAPIVSNMPDITIGNMDEGAPVGARVFVFTDAFAFDTKVNYKGTAAAVSDLKWSFAEEGTAQWFQINGIDPLAVGAAAIATAETSGAPKTPGAKDLRAAAATASFRDIVLSPVSGGVTPTAAQLSEHAAGKVVRFYISDGAGVGKHDILVKAVDGAYDSATVPTNTVTFKKVDDFMTDPILAQEGVGSYLTAGWWYTITTNNVGRNGTPGTPVYQSASKAIELKSGVNEVAGTELGYNTVTLSDNINNRLKWTDLGATAAEAATKIVRAKFWIYAGGQSTTGKPANSIQIPNMRLKVQNGYLVANALEVLHGSVNMFTAQGQTVAANTLLACKQIAPSSNSSSPSAYRVDFKPINPTFIFTNNKQADVGYAFMRQVELYQTAPYENGSLFLSQTSIGVYPAAAVTPGTGPGSKLLRTYSGQDLRNFGGTSVYTSVQEDASGGYLNGASNYQAHIYTDIAGGGGTGYPKPTGTKSYDSSKIAITYDNTGALLDARNFTPNIANMTLALLSVDVNPVPKPLGQWVAADFTSVPRVARDKVYLVRYTVDNPYVATNLMPGIMFRATVGYYFGQRLEVVPVSIGGDAMQQSYITSCMPGATARVYESIVQSPMNSEINVNQSAWDSQPGYGIANMDSIRGFGVIGVTLFSTMGTNANEKGTLRLRQVDVYEFDLIGD